MIPIVVQKPHEVTDALAELGIRTADVRRAIERAEEATRGCSNNDPVTFEGTLLWAKTTRGLRDLMGRRWRRERQEGLELVVRDDGRVAIVVATGDDLTGTDSTTQITGLVSGSPSTRHTKGTGLIRAITRNRDQLRMDFEGVNGDPSKSGIKRVTWVLLLNATDDEVRAELSLPLGMQMTTKNEGYVVEWARRIIIDAVPRDRKIEDLASPVDDEPDIDVEVTRIAQ